MPVSRKLKPLAVGSCIGDLNKHAEDVKISITNELQCRQYCTSFVQVFRKAEAIDDDGDEENAYILFMRVLFIFEKIKNCYEYQKKKKVYNDIMKANNILKAMERAETLSKSLEARYKQLEIDRKSLTSPKGKPSSSQENRSASINKDVSARPPSSPLKPKAAQNGGLPPKVNGAANEPNGSISKSLPDVPSTDDEMDGSSSTTVPSKIDPWIDPNELYNLLLSNSSDSILIMDTRPPDEFAASRIKNASISLINIRDELLKPGANINSIERRLSKDVWNVWIARGSKDHVIIMDHNSTRDSTRKDSAVQILKDAIWNRASKTKSEPRLLDSGFNGWLLYYPSLCTNPFYKKVKPNTTSVIPDHTKLLSDLSYPTLNGLITSNERPASAAKVPNASEKEEATGVPSDKLAQTGKEEDDMFAKLRRQLDGPAESGSKAEPLGNRPGNSGDHTKGLDTRPRTGSSGSKYPKSKTNEGIASDGITPSNTDSANRMLANQSEPKRTLANDRMINGTAQLPKENSGPESRPGEDRITFGKERRENQASSGVKKKNVDDIEISTAKYARNDSGYGFAGSLTPDSNRINRAHGIDQDAGAKFRPFSEKGSSDSLAASPRLDKSEIGFVSRDAKAFHNDALRNESMGSTEGNRSPTKGTSGVVQKPGLISSQPGVAGQVSGKYATIPRMQGPTQPPVSSVGTSGTPKPYTDSSVPQGGFSSNTIPRAKTNQPSGHLPRVEQLKPVPGIQNVSTTGLTGPSSSSGTTITASSIPNSGVTMLSSNTPPVTHRPQQSNQYTLNHHQPGVDLTSVGDQQGAPKQANRHQQPQSLPHEQSRPESADAAAKEQRTEKEANVSEIITSPGLPYGWEKSIDRKTGRVYYIDHTTKSTHWELPPDFYASRERDAALKQKRKAPEPPIAKDVGQSKPSLKRSLSTPNLADMDADKENAKPITPIVDRSSKPLQPPTQLVDRSTKPLSKSRLEALSPIYGSKGANLTGLKNLGNTCYMNSVIQCLSSTVPLARYFNSGQYLKHLNSRSMNRRPEEVAKELAFLIKVLWSGQYRSVSPIDFKAAISRFATQFAGYKQQDAHEFLMFFMDGIHEDTNKIIKRTPMIEQKNDNVPDAISSVNAWNDYVKNNDSVIVDLFQGQFRSTVRCKTCGKKSVTFDVFSCLPLELTSQRACSLDDCIRAFTKPEMIGGNDSWKCTGCKAYREATKTIELWMLPPVVIFQLKRFSSDGRWHNKLQTRVDFPISQLDMSRYIVGPGSVSTKYNLYSVVNHYGSFESGHYTAYCQNQQSWYCYNDNVVSSIGRGELKSSAAYLLFYTRMDPKDMKSYLK